MTCISVRWILFDAVGTLLYPQPSVADAYLRIGRRFGCQLTRGEVAKRFDDAFRATELASHEYTTNQLREYQRWQQIVCDVFHDLPQQPDALFQALWNHFADPANWRVYDDVAEAWTELAEMGFELGVASNFDDRLEKIIRQQEPLSSTPHVYHSAGIGFRKPSVQFFRWLQKKLGAPAHEMMFVGDDYTNDLRGAHEAGWHALLIERKSCDADRLGDLRDLAARVVLHA